MGVTLSAERIAINPEFDFELGLDKVDWQRMKDTMIADDWDNGRTPDQYRRSFENSFATMIVYHGAEIIGTARALSDGVCNAYIIDVWTHSAYRRKGIATRMMELLLERLPGQHVYLFTDDMVEFYKKLGFRKWEIGMGMVVGQWLEGKIEE